MGLFSRRAKAADVRPTVSNRKPEASTPPKVELPEEKIVPLPPVYCLTEDDVSEGFDRIGQIQRDQDERMHDPVAAARGLVALADGVAGYYLRRGGNRNLYSTLIENIMAWSNHTYAPVRLRAMGTPAADAAGAAFKVITEFTGRYKFLEETGGRAIPGDELSPLPKSVEEALKADGWSLEEDSLLIRAFESSDHYVQEVLLHPEEGGFELVVGLMELPDAETPSWVHDSAVPPTTLTRIGDRVMLKDQIVDQRLAVVEISARAQALALRATELEAEHAGLGERQIRLTDPGSPEGSLDEGVFALMRACTFGLGLYGPGTVDEAIAEFARLNPKILNSLAVEPGLGVALGDPQLPLLAMTGPHGSLIAVCPLPDGDGNLMDAVNFGGKDVANGWQMLMVSRGGVTFGTVGRLVEAAHAVPLWEIDAFSHTTP